MSWWMIVDWGLDQWVINWFNWGYVFNGSFGGIPSGGRGFSGATSLVFIGLIGWLHLQWIVEGLFKRDCERDPLELLVRLIGVTSLMDPLEGSLQGGGAFLEQLLVVTSSMDHGGIFKGIFLRDPMGYVRNCWTQSWITSIDQMDGSRRRFGWWRDPSGPDRSSDNGGRWLGPWSSYQQRIKRQCW